MTDDLINKTVQSVAIYGYGKPVIFKTWKDYVASCKTVEELALMRSLREVKE